MLMAETGTIALLERENKKKRGNECHTCEEEKMNVKSIVIPYQTSEVHHSRTREKARKCKKIKSKEHCALNFLHLNDKTQ